MWSSIIPYIPISSCFPSVYVFSDVKAYLRIDSFLKWKTTLHILKCKQDPIFYNNFLLWYILLCLAFIFFLCFGLPYSAWCSFSLMCVLFFFFIFFFCVIICVRMAESSLLMVGFFWIQPLCPPRNTKGIYVFVWCVVWMYECDLLRLVYISTFSK